MAAATAAQGLNWNDNYRNDLLREFRSFACRKPARTIKASGSFPSLNRSLSLGSPTFPRRRPSPVRRKAKSVHFADSKGLALVSVLTFNEEKELCEQFLKLASRAQPASVKCQPYYGRDATTKKNKGSKRSQTKLPGAVIRTLSWQKVCVDKFEVSKSGIRGNVYVANLAFEKQITARYTFDSWRTHGEIVGEYDSHYTNEIDKFVFDIPVPRNGPARNVRVEFAVSYKVLGDTFWDNNNGFNYHVLFSINN